MAETQHKIERTRLGLYTIKSPFFHDHRGYFHEIVPFGQLQREIGQNFSVGQTNVARSDTNVIRGMHAENWNKIVYAMTGVAYLAIADIRPESPTCGEVETFVIGPEDTEDTRYAILVPRGFANSICVIEGPVTYLYQTDARYDGTDTKAVAWDDPDLNIPWPVKDPILSERDKHNPTLRQVLAAVPA